MDIQRENLPWTEMYQAVGYKCGIGSIRPSMDQGGIGQKVFKKLVRRLGVV